MKKQELLLLDTYNTEHLDYELYKEWCELNEVELKGEDSQHFYEWVADEIQNEIDDLFANLKCSDYQQPCIITGSVGRWNGTFEVEQTRCESLSDAISKCWGRCDDIIVRKRNSVIKVNALHHDGTNYFEIRLLSGLGEERWGRNGKVNMNDRKNFLTLPEYLW